MVLSDSFAILVLARVWVLELLFFAVVRILQAPFILSGLPAFLALCIETQSAFFIALLIEFGNYFFSFSESR
jgi:hypothetical protein